jgi:hypothetical protein
VEESFKPAAEVEENAGDYGTDALKGEEPGARIDIRMSSSLERETEGDNQENVYSEVFQLENHFCNPLIKLNLGKPGYEMNPKWMKKFFYELYRLY